MSSTNPMHNDIMTNVLSQMPQSSYGPQNINLRRNFYTSVSLDCEKQNPIDNNTFYKTLKSNETKTPKDSDNLCPDSSIDWNNLSSAQKEQFKYWEIQPENKPDFDLNPLDTVSTTSQRDTTSLTHVDADGSLKMVDVGDKTDTSRVAIATGLIILGKQAFMLVKENKIKKGDVMTVAKIAGVAAAKRTSDLIPLCHNILLTKVDIELELQDENFSVRVTALVKTHGKTGVEMEAITAVAMAMITVYDMCKAVSKDMIITDIKLIHKSGGKSGVYSRQ